MIIWIMITLMIILFIMMMIIKRKSAGPVGHTAVRPHAPNLWVLKSQGYIPLNSHLPRLQMLTPLS